MTHAQQLAAARETVLQVAGGSPIGELILIRGGYCAGHRFTFQDGYAVWFHEEQQVRFHWHDGSPRTEMALAGRDERRAA